MSSPRDEFEDLKKLLAWKKHEQPPPGFFPSLSDRIMSRLDREEALLPATWWEWLVASFDTKPVFACAYAVVISGLLLMGFSLSYAFESDLAEAPQHFSPWLAATQSPGAVFPSEETDAYLTPQSAYPTPTRSALSPETPQLLFTRGQSLFLPASYTPSR